jgi:hypothetical protein
MTWRTSLSARNDNGSRIKLGALLATGLGVALLAAACTVTSGDGTPGGGTPSTGGMGGMGGDSSTGGANSTGGSNATGGMAGNSTAEIDCHPAGAVSGTIETTEPDAGDTCTHCAWQKCNTQYGKCFATDPDSACGGHVGNDGELDCMFQCFYDRYDDGLFVGDADDVAACAALCDAHPSCDGSEPSSVTQDLALCLIDIDASDNCLAECDLL